jgi:putative Mg2+ transporter-C (MgtC) family protein
MELDAILSVAPFDWVSIGTSILCGSIIGIERQLRGKPVGIRTSSLITLGTYIFIAASLYVSAHMAGPEKVVTDPSRIIGQVITGIGFLGAGVMLARDGFVLGG